MEKIMCNGNEKEELKKSAVKQKNGYHIYRNHICKTDKIGFPTPKNLSLFDLKVHVSEGFIPLWEQNVILRWSFDERSFQQLTEDISIDEMKTKIRNLLAQAIILWGEAAPVKFTENDDLADFQILIEQSDSCTIDGCSLAEAFFPDSGQHQLKIYPKIFEQELSEQIETLAHELGHIFGLRHFFADISEKEWPIEIFGSENKFTIMNYYAESVMTQTDRDDLKNLYQSVWSGQLTHINGTKIRLFKPYHDAGNKL